MLEKLFHLRAHGTTVRTEILAGLTTFAAMAYILAVNPLILSSTGMDKAALVTVTALASAAMTLLMAGMTNYPLALAPGMGLNALFAFNICLGLKIPWPAALGLVFYSGVIIALLSVSGLRKRLVEAIPNSLKIAITCGIGLFIAFIGLKEGGVIASHPVTFVTLGSLSSPGALLTVGGIILAAILVARRVTGALLLTAVAIMAAGVFLPGQPGADGTAGAITVLPASPFSFPASIAPTFLKLDLGYFWDHWQTALPLVLTLVFADLFDNIGTLIGVCRKAGLTDKDGEVPKIGNALLADAGAAMFGAVLGTSTTTSYIESAAGVEQGGRTGLTSVTVAVCFLAALFLTPLILAIPAVATAPILVIVGVFMMQSAAELDLADFPKAVPAVLTILIMPLAFSISEGIAIGFTAHVLLMLGLGRFKEINWVAGVLAALFMLHFLTK